MRIEVNRVNTPPANTDVAQTRPEGTTPSLDVEVGARAAKQGPTNSSQQPEMAELEQAVEKMNRAMRAFNLQTLQFEVTKSNRIVVTVIDTNTGEIIRQIPPEELMDNFHRMQDVIGVLIDRRV